MAKQYRELKKPLQNLVHDMLNFGEELERIYKVYGKLKEDTDTLVLQYMSKKRKGD